MKGGASAEALSLTHRLVQTHPHGRTRAHERYNAQCFATCSLAPDVDKMYTLFSVQNGMQSEIMSGIGSNRACFLVPFVRFSLIVFLIYPC